VLHLCGATFVRAVSQSITSPQRILEISALNFPGVNSDGLFHDKDAGLGLVADIRAYAQRFWKQVTGSAHSPPVIVKDRFSPPYTYCAVTMDIGQEQNSVGPSLLLEVAAYPLTPDDPFLPLVTKLVLSVDTENPVLALDEDKWPVVGRLSALHTLIIEAESPWELMHEVEAWATRRKQQRAVLVEFTPTFNEELDPAQEHLNRPKLQWTASDGPIQNAEWGAYMEEVELYKLRQEAEEIVLPSLSTIRRHSFGALRFPFLPRLVHHLIFPKIQASKLMSGGLALRRIAPHMRASRAVHPSPRLPGCASHYAFPQVHMAALLFRRRRCT
jgi:hypothetical protein